MRILSKIKKSVIPKEIFEDDIPLTTNDFVIPLTVILEEKVVIPITTVIMDGFKTKALKIDEQIKKKKFLCHYFDSLLMINDNYNVDRIRNVEELLDAIKNSLPYDCELEILSITPTRQNFSRFKDVKSDIIIDTLYDFCKYVSDNEITL